MSDQNQVEALVQGYQRRDPRLYDILRLLASQIESVRVLVNQSLTPETVATEDPSLALPASLSYSLPGDSVKLSWSSTDSDGNPLSAVSIFEIRKGTSWATGELQVRTASLSANLIPNLATGTHTYLLKTINSSGAYSVNFLTVEVLIGSVASVSFTASAIDNNVLLYWASPASHSFNISYYEISREAVSLGTSNGTFASYFERTGGTFTYGIKAFDLAGNVSVETFADVLVSSPPDFELVSNILSIFSGTKVKCLLDAGQLLSPVKLAETWQAHFNNNGWSTIQDQVTAGYPIYIQPTDV